jgi:hypothetical protein
MIIFLPVGSLAARAVRIQGDQAKCDDGRLLGWCSDVQLKKVNIAVRGEFGNGSS